LSETEERQCTNDEKEPVMVPASQAPVPEWVVECRATWRGHGEGQKVYWALLSVAGFEG
jgi:hypothetical protein